MFQGRRRRASLLEQRELRSLQALGDWMMLASLAEGGLRSGC